MLNGWKTLESINTQYNLPQSSCSGHQFSSSLLHIARLFMDYFTHQHKGYNKEAEPWTQAVRRLNFRLITKILRSCSMLKQRHNLDQFHGEDSVTKILRSCSMLKQRHNLDQLHGEDSVTKILRSCNMLKQRHNLDQLHGEDSVWHASKIEEHLSTNDTSISQGKVPCLKGVP